MNTQPTSKISDTVTYGIEAVDVENLEIENCLISGWTGAGISVTNQYNNATNALIHHCVIKDNNFNWTTASTFGYGITMRSPQTYYYPTKQVEVKILYNLFENNKHAIAGSSGGGEIYEAYYNCIYPNSLRDDHSFDMHGCYDRYKGAFNSRCQPHTSDNNYAGKTIKIEHNFFEDRVAQQNRQEAIQIRGIPRDIAIIQNNYIEGDADEMLIQELGNGTSINYQDNIPFVGINKWDIANNKHNHNITYFNVSFSATDEWKLIAPFVWDNTQLGVGDFDGDGKDDLIRTNSGKWYVSRRGSGNWEQWQVSTVNATDLLFFDFTNDGKVDCLTAFNGDWKLSVSNGNSFGPWQPAGNLGYDIGDVQVGDFDGNGYSDLIIFENGDWKHALNFGNNSQASFQSFTPINNHYFSNVSNNEYTIHDFDGNGYSDIFINDNGKWEILYNWSSGFQQPWKHVANSAFLPSQLIFGDFDGDNDVDIFNANGTNWYICNYLSNNNLNTFSGWGNPVNNSSFSIPLLFHGDFNGDNKKDIALIYDQSSLTHHTSTAKFASANTSNDQMTFNRPKEITYYPNPTNGLVFIKTDVKPKKTEVFNTLGKLIMSTTKTVLDLSNQTNGLYIIKTYTEDHVTVSRVFKR